VYEYGAGFYRFNASFAVRSAQRIVTRLTAAFPVCSDRRASGVAAAG
jgi:hypothetical protein